MKSEEEAEEQVRARVDVEWRWCAASNLKLTCSRSVSHSSPAAAASYVNYPPDQGLLTPQIRVAYISGTTTAVPRYRVAHYCQIRRSLSSCVVTLFGLILDFTLYQLRSRKV